VLHRTTKEVEVKSHESKETGYKIIKISFELKSTVSYDKLFLHEKRAQICNAWRDILNSIVQEMFEHVKYGFKQTRSVVLCHIHL